MDILQMVKHIYLKVFVLHCKHMTAGIWRRTDSLAIPALRIRRRELVSHTVPCLRLTLICTWSAHHAVLKHVLILRAHILT